MTPSSPPPVGSNRKRERDRDNNQEDSDLSASSGLPNSQPTQQLSAHQSMPFPVYFDEIENMLLSVTSYFAGQSQSEIGPSNISAGLPVQTSQGLPSESQGAMLMPCMLSSINPGDRYLLTNSHSAWHGYRKYGLPREHTRLSLSLYRQGCCSRLISVFF
jgi:hypothetical protein